MDISQISDKIFQIGKLGKLPSFVIACTCWTILLIPQNLTDTLGITDIVNSYRPWFGIFTVLCTVYLLSYITYEYLSGHLSQWLVVNRVKNRLRNLTEDEKEALREYINSNRRTVQFSMSEGVAGGLEAKKILYRSSNLGSLGDYFPYNIQDFAFDYLIKRKYLLEESINQIKKT